MLPFPRSGSERQRADIATVALELIRSRDDTREGKPDRLYSPVGHQERRSDPVTPEQSLKPTFRVRRDTAGGESAMWECRSSLTPIGGSALPGEKPGTSKGKMRPRRRLRVA